MKVPKSVSKHSFSIHYSIVLQIEPHIRFYTSFERKFLSAPWEPVHMNLTILKVVRIQ